MAIATKQRSGVSAAQSLDRARARITEAVGLPDPPSNPFIESEEAAIVLARAVVELAAILEAAR